MQWNPYVMFDGTCEKAFSFYEKCLGAKKTIVSRYGDLPPEAGEMPDSVRDRVMHARLEIDGQTLMGSDCFPFPGKSFEGIKGSSVAVLVETPEKAERIFAALSDGASIEMPMAQTFFSLRFGMLVDKYGVPWMINCEKSV